MSLLQRHIPGALLAVGLLTASIASLHAQGVDPPELAIPRIPRVSPGAESRQIVGLSEITVTYHRPGVKGRSIWGGLLPYDQIWRAGANEPTLISFSDPVTVDGHALKAGTYRFLVIPSQGPWTLIFNAELENSGSMYDSTYDVLKLAVTPEAGPHEEWMSFSFTDLTSRSTRVVLAWEKIRIGFSATFDTMEKLSSSLGDWRTLNQAARYAVAEEGGEKRALGWVDRSLAIERNSSNTRTKAEIQAKRGNFSEAVQLGEESIALSRARNPNADVSTVEALISEWKAKK